MLKPYHDHVAERTALGLPPLPLNAEQTAELVELLKNPPAGEEAFVLNLLQNRVPAGVDQAAYVKAAFLSDIASGKAVSPLVSPHHAVRLLGTMLGGYNVQALVGLLDGALGAEAAQALSHTTLMFDAFHDVQEKMQAGNAHARKLIESWANAEWFTSRRALPVEIKSAVFKVPGETNTDDLSPAQEAWSRPDIPLHAKAMLVNKMPDGLATIEQLKAKGLPLAYVGDIVGTGSSRKSAINSVQWHMGEDIPHIPNKRTGGIVLGGKIAPIFFNTAEDSGALPIQCDVSKLNTGDVIVIHPLAGRITDESGATISTFELAPLTMPDEVRTGGRIPLIIGRGLTTKAREVLGLPPSELFIKPVAPKDTGKGYTLAQKMVGRACGVEGIRPGTYCEPEDVHRRFAGYDRCHDARRVERIGLHRLLCRSGDAELLPYRGVPQAGGHQTAAYPAGIHVQPWRRRLRPGDGVIHSWLNRMMLPDTVGTGGDSHTRFPSASRSPPAPGWWRLPPPWAPCRSTCRSRCWCVSRAKCSPASPCAIWSTPFPMRRSRRAN